MSRNSSTGAYTMPANSFRPAVSGTTINSTDWNNTAADIETALSYVYGTFTPTLLFGGGNSGMTGTFTGEYTQIGNRVFYTIAITLTAKGSSTGNASIGGLPVTATSNDDRAILTAVKFMTQTAGYTNFYFTSGSGGTTGSIREQGNSGANTIAATEASFSNTTFFAIC